MRTHTRLVVALALALATPQAGFASAPQREETTDTTVISGGWQLGPGLLPAPVAADPRRASGRPNGSMQGAWTGRWQSDLVGSVDVQSGDYRLESRTPSTFTGFYTRDGSRGTLRWVETIAGNLFTGGVSAHVDILGGSGDPAFQCSAGHFEFSGFQTVQQASYGGYSGTWTHGCKRG